MQHLSEEEACKQAFVMAIKDSLNVVSGKWKLAIVCTMLRGPRRFNEIERMLGGLTPRMLARELRELEVNGVLARTRTAQAAAGFTTAKPLGKAPVHYELTPSGQNLEAIIIGMAQWGATHRALTAQNGPLGSALGQSTAPLASTIKAKTAPSAAAAPAVEAHRSA